MDDRVLFSPPRRQGLILHGSVLATLLIGEVAAMFFAFQQPTGAYFVLLLLLSVVLVIPLILTVYRGYALIQASYELTRDGLRLRWGLRAEDIPLSEIEWVRPAAEMGFPLPAPWLAMPGALLGLRKVEGLGDLEYIASNESRLLLIATPRKVYAISPEDTRVFMRAFQSAFELGSLAPIQKYSTKPAAYLQNVWTDHTARLLIMIGFGLTLLLFILTSLITPLRSTIALGYSGTLQPLRAPADHLLLLPVLGIGCYIADTVGGLFLYRRAGLRSAALILWATGWMAPALLIAAVLMSI